MKLFDRISNRVWVRVLVSAFVFYVAFLFSIVPAYADDVTSSYSIVIPQAVTLSAGAGNAYTGTVSVTIKGTLNDGQSVYLVPSAPVMTSEFSNTAAATITSNTKSVWTKDEAAGEGTAASYGLSVNLTDAGKWTGTMSFYCGVGNTYDVTIGDAAFSIIGSSEDAAKITFSSDNTDVASVDSAGTVTIGSTEGTAKITKKYTDTNLSVVDVVNVAKKAYDVESRPAFKMPEYIETVKTTINRVYFLTKKPEGSRTLAYGPVDASETQDGSIMVELSSSGSLAVYNNEDVVGEEVPVRLPEDCSGMFKHFGIYEISGTVDSSNVTNMSQMFSTDELMTTYALEGDVSNVKNMSQMFYGCKKLTSATPLANWKTSNVENIMGMFNVCTSLQSLDIRNFDTRNITNEQYYYRFMASCTSLKMLTVGENFATPYLPFTPTSSIKSSSSFASLGLFYVPTKSTLIIMGTPSALLKTYDFATENRTVTFRPALPSATSYENEDQINVDTVNEGNSEDGSQTTREDDYTIIATPETAQSSNLKEENPSNKESRDSAGNNTESALEEQESYATSAA